MREILFKAKRIDNGEWVYWNFYGEFVGKGGKRRTKIESKGRNSIRYYNSVLSASHLIDLNTICQYTGLTDKNGKKIWENDIVKKHFYTDYDAYANSEEYVGFVKYEYFAYVIKSTKGKLMRTFPIIVAIAESEDVKHFEVIGNIFDNSELLEGGAE